MLHSDFHFCGVGCAKWPLSANYSNFTSTFCICASPPKLHDHQPCSTSTSTSTSTRASAAGPQPERIYQPFYINIAEDFEKLIKVVLTKSLTARTWRVQGILAHHRLQDLTTPPNEAEEMMTFDETQIAEIILGECHHGGGVALEASM